METVKLEDDAVYRELKKYNCLYEQELGHHFIGVSGKHLAGYCNVDPVLPRRHLIQNWMTRLVDNFACTGITSAFTSAVGGIPLVQWGAEAMERSSSEEVMAVWADKVQPKGCAIERAGFAELLTGDVLLFEDMINQQFTISELIRIVRECGGSVVGVAAIAANSKVTAESLDVPKLVVLTNFFYDAWLPEECELCAAKVPIVVDDALGHGAKFREKNPGYAGGWIELLKE